MALGALTGWACASAPRAVHPVPEDLVEVLVASSPLGVTPDLDPLALDPAVLDWLERTFGSSGAPHPVTLERLTRAMGPGGALNLRYTHLGVYTATETFHRAQGNCLSQTHLFVALARALGMQASYREIVQMPDWLKVGEYRVQNRHVAARVHVIAHGTWHVDFGRTSDGWEEVGRRISDRRARAQHFNNLGAVALTEGRATEAIRHFNRAILLERSLGFVWANLGTAYHQLRDDERAEWALRQAADLEPSAVIPLQALARLYRELGEEALAQVFDARAESARWKNPFVLYRRGRDQLEQGAPQAAIDLFEEAAKGLPELMPVQMYLGRAYYEAKRFRDARDAFRSAHALATTEEEIAELKRFLLELLPADPHRRAAAGTGDS